jgi:hypothetical protein
MQQGDVKFTQQNYNTTIKCPRCESVSIKTLNYATKAVGTLGTVAGTAAGIASVMGGAELGATAGMVAGPAGAIVGGLFGALMAAVVGGSAGCAAGAALGGAIDETILDNYRCLDCDYSFGKRAA